MTRAFLLPIGNDMPRRWTRPGKSAAGTIVTCVASISLLAAPGCSGNHDGTDAAPPTSSAPHQAEVAPPGAAPAGTVRPAPDLAPPAPTPSPSARERRAAAGSPDVERNAIGMAFVRVPAGSYVIGSPEREAGRRPNEGPRREVTVSRPFLMGVFEVTNAEFARFIEATGHRTEAELDPGGGFGFDFATGDVARSAAFNWRTPGFPGFDPGPEHPVVMVSWRDAKAFCAWLSVIDGRRHRLPTEAEWEYAARGGTTSAWWTGPDADDLRHGANIADRSLAVAVPAFAARTEAWSDGYPFLAPVGSFAPNPFGLYDMHGNAWEWCEDLHLDDAYARFDPIDPRTTGDGPFRVIRGGGWLDPARRNRSAQRIYFDPTFRACLLSGFRVVMEPGPTGVDDEGVDRAVTPPSPFAPTPAAPAPDGR